ncbi:hypothetical protein [Variovorax sp. dw_308]|uniref:hypothetical protein n=1 Tax=Variovorax sp. dw_308 TaxID=2721546 RepID=UPI001C443185|nr:hypothetical protein [Variovorax sp. dw_308]
MGPAASFFRTPLLVAGMLPFFCAALSGPAGLIAPPPEEGSPAYLAVQHARDAFSTEVEIDLSDTEQALTAMQQANQIVAPGFYF